MAAAQTEIKDWRQCYQPLQQIEIEERRQRYQPLLTTEQAATATGLSAYELRVGFKNGKYPALVIGAGGKRPRLRWRLDLLIEAIEQAMQEKQDAEETMIVSNWKERRQKIGRG